MRTYQNWLILRWNDLRWAGVEHINFRNRDLLRIHCNVLDSFGILIYRYLKCISDCAILWTLTPNNSKESNCIEVSKMNYKLSKHRAISMNHNHFPLLDGFLPPPRPRPREVSTWGTPSPTAFDLERAVRRGWGMLMFDALVETCCTIMLGASLCKWDEDDGIAVLKLPSVMAMASESTAWTSSAAISWQYMRSMNLSEKVTLHTSIGKSICAARGDDINLNRLVEVISDYCSHRLGGIWSFPECTKNIIEFLARSSVVTSSCWCICRRVPEDAPIEKSYHLVHVTIIVLQQCTN